MRPSALSYHIALMFLFIFLENLNAFNLLICLTPISNLTIWEENLLIFFLVLFCSVFYSSFYALFRREFKQCIWWPTHLKQFVVALLLHALSNVTAAKVQNHSFFCSFPNNTHFHNIYLNVWIQTIQRCRMVIFNISCDLTTTNTKYYIQ